LGAINKLSNTLTASNDLQRPITNWYGRFQSWISAQTYAQISGCIQTTCPDCVLPLNDSYSLAKRVHHFVTAIPLRSECCQVR
jgi:hypothetical protein